MIFAFPRDLNNDNIYFIFFLQKKQRHTMMNAKSI